MGIIGLPGLSFGLGVRDWLILSIAFSLGMCLEDSLEDRTFQFKLPNIFYENDQSKAEASLDTETFTIRNGYPFEAHNVTTSDGYYLQLHRIRHGKNSTTTNTRPVLVQHGLSCTSRAFVDNNNQSLAFILADHGYDVWLGNSRGNNYSVGHVKYAYNSDQYWDFSWDEIAKYDMSAMIDHILLKTKKKNLLTVGHSQGTTVLFALLSSNSSYHSKVKGFIAMSPVAYLAHTTSPASYPLRIKISPPLIKFIFENILHTHAVFFPTDLTKNLLYFLCPTYNPLFCESTNFLTTGQTDWKPSDNKELAFHSLSCPYGGMSYRTFFHFAQLVSSRRFQYFDFGENWNIKTYGTVYPPEYDLTNVHVPVALFWSPSDPLVAEGDRNTLRQLLPNLVEYFEVSDTSYTHTDFMWGNNVSNIVYAPLVAELNKMWSS